MSSAKPAPEWKARGNASERRDVIMRGLNSVLRKRRRTQALRMKDVADHLGLVKGNLYYYFKNKEDLIYHCHVKCAQASLAALARVEKSGGTATARLHALLIEHIMAMTEGDYGGVGPGLCRRHERGATPQLRETPRRIRSRCARADQAGRHSRRVRDRQRAHCRLRDAGRH